MPVPLVRVSTAGLVLITAWSSFGSAASFSLLPISDTNCVEKDRGCPNLRAQNPSSWKESPIFDKDNIDPRLQSPIPVMPSQLFQELALSQLELLASSMPYQSISTTRGEENLAPSGKSKIRSMALYLPQENSFTGQLEFSPAVLYPHPRRERIFIANNSTSGVAPSMPRTLTKLPGFAHAASLLPAYPMISMSASDTSVGVVEEVLCDLKMGGTSLSVPLFAGCQTVGVLLVSPVKSPNRQSIWTEADRQQVARAAKSLSLALSMDAKQNALQMENRQVQEALSDSLHQFKNPLQALRTYGKLLQRRIADSDQGASTPQLLELAEHLMVQSERLVERLKPVDAIVDALSETVRPPLLNPVEAKALVPWKPPSLAWEDDAMDFARETPAKRLNQTEDSARNEMELNRFGTSSSQRSSLLGEMELEMAFIMDCLDSVFTAFGAIGAERGILFDVQEVGELPGVVIWPEALQESMINLLDNAFKYVTFPYPGRPTNFKAKVRVRLLPNPDPLPPGVTILVEDNGPGISAQDSVNVFERGVRSRDTSAVEGNGIGLDIAKTLVEQMEGTLHIANNNAYPDSLHGAVLELVVFRKQRCVNNSQ